MAILRARLAAVLVLWPLLAWAGGAAAADRHQGYYYPEPATKETYVARSRVMEEADRSIRIGFVTGITQQLLTKPYPPTAAIFAKGAEAQKLIIVALEDGRIDTLYRARALFANLTAVSRGMPIMQELGVQDWFTFFDLVRMLGFAQITISNGREFSHQVILE